MAAENHTTATKLSCVHVDVACIIGMGLKYLPTKRITFNQLRLWIEEFEVRNTCHVINLSRDDMYAMQQRYANVFVPDFHNHCYIRANDSDEYYKGDYILEEFVYELPERIKHIVENELLLLGVKMIV